MEIHVPSARCLLELGCGRAPARGARIGIDVDEDAAHTAAARGVLCVVGDVRRLPLANQTVDGILARGVLHHIPDLTVVLDEAYRVLEPGGFFAAVDALPMPAEEYLEMSRQLTEQGIPTEPRNGIDPDELGALAMAAGFLPPQRDVHGEWTHATPPYVDRVFASPAATYVFRRH